MKHKTIYIFGALSAIVIAVVFVAFISMKQSPSKSQAPALAPNANAKLQQCPDEWIDNQMPSTDPKKTTTQYYILDGVRRELSEFDLQWVQNNCKLKKQTVF